MTLVDKRDVEENSARRLRKRRRTGRFAGAPEVDDGTETRPEPTRLKKDCAASFELPHAWLRIGRVDR